MNIYDLLKILALLTMIIDHVGEFFYPEQHLFRAVGRMAFPLFLFLVGYSHQFKVKSDIIIGCLLLIAVDAWTYYPLFPINILATIVVTRLFLGWLEKQGRLTTHPWEILIAVLVWFPIAVCLFEYGSIAILFAMIGYYARNDDARSQKIMRYMLALTLGLHAVCESHAFNFTPPENAVMVLGLAFVTLCMLHMSMKPLPAQSPLLQKAIKILSRHTLLIYVMHLTVFQIIETIIHPGPTHISAWLG